MNGFWFMRMCGKCRTESQISSLVIENEMLLVRFVVEMLRIVDDGDGSKFFAGQIFKIGYLYCKNSLKEILCLVYFFWFLIQWD